MSESGLRLPQVQTALLVLHLHNCLNTEVRRNHRTSTPPARIAVAIYAICEVELIDLIASQTTARGIEYEANISNILMRLRFPRFLLHARTLGNDEVISKVSVLQICA